MRLFTRISITNIGIVVVTTTAIGLLTHFRVERAMAPVKLRELQLGAEQVANQLAENIDRTRTQVIALSSTPPIQGIIRAREAGGIDPFDGSTETLWRSRLATIFQGHLQANPEYYQIRYIGIGDGGKEIVRVDRNTSEGRIRICNDNELSRKGNSSYLTEAFKVGPEQIYISKFNLNRENDQIEEPFVPTVRVAKAIFGDNGAPFGVVVINLDLNRTIEKITQLPIPESQVFLYNDQGEFLAHPDGSRVLASELGRPGLAFDEFASISGLVGIPPSEPVFYDDPSGKKSAAGFGMGTLPDGRIIRAMVTLPYSEVTSSLHTVRTSSAIAGIVVLILAMITSFFFALTISKPIEAMTKKVESYDFQEPIEFEPIAVSEFSILADSLEKLTEDIKTKSRALEAETRERLKTQAAAEAKAMFLANMSHEIRTPMNGVVGMANVLMNSELTHEQKYQLGIIKRSADQLLTVIDDILDFSKIEAGKLKVESIEIEPEIIVEDVVSLLGEAAQAKQIKLLSWIDPNLDRFVYGDPIRMRQVLTNLVSNAIKFTETGQVLISLSKLEQNGDSITLRYEVEDTGIGIPDSQLDHIFGSFNQADISTKRTHGGTGLGLAISKKLVSLMDGEIHVESTPGKGSRFWVDIKTRVVSPSERNAIDALNAKGNPPEIPNDLKILVAEDNAVNQLVIQAVLNNMGIHPDIARNGEEVLRAIDRKSYDLILMDCHMPVMDGFEATRKIRRLNDENKDLIIVALSASALEPDRNACRNAGMNDFLSKPVRPNLLERTLARYGNPAQIRKA